MTASKAIRLSRRSFIAAGAAASLGAMAAPSHAPGGRPRAALIGCGAGGRELAHILACPGAPLRLVALCDRDDQRAGRVAAQIGVEATVDWARCVERSDVDAVLVALPDYLHGPVALAAMAAGKHVYLLPPFTRHGEEAHRLESEARRCDRVLHVAADPAEEGRWARAGRLLGQTGAPLWIQAESAHGASLAEGWSRNRERSHGPAARQLFNMLYPMQHHLAPGTPSRATVLGGVFHGAVEATPDEVLMTLRYDQGTTVVLASAGESGARHPVMRGALDSVDLPLAPVGEGSLHDLARFAAAIAGDRADAEKRLYAARVAQGAVCDAMEQWARWDRSKAWA